MVWKQMEVTEQCNVKLAMSPLTPSWTLTLDSVEALPLLPHPTDYSYRLALVTTTASGKKESSTNQPSV